MTEEAQRIHEKLNRVVIDRDEFRELYLSKQGYLFDSLVFRFKEYQAKAYEHDKYNLKCKGYNEQDANKRVLEAHNRDLMRFIQILDEAIGEHK